MSELDNYIYYSICEKSYEVFQNNLDVNYPHNYDIIKCSNYRSFCILMQHSMKLKDLSGRETKHISLLKAYLILIYGLTSDESMEYIFNYFMDERYIYLEEPVRLMNIYFKN